MGGLEATMRMRQLEWEEGATIRGHTSVAAAAAADSSSSFFPSGSVLTPHPSSASLTRRDTPLLPTASTRPSPHRTYIACVSGNVRDEFVQAAHQAGVDSYIGKVSSFKTIQEIKRSRTSIDSASTHFLLAVHMFLSLSRSLCVLCVVLQPFSREGLAATLQSARAARDLAEPSS